MRGQKGCEPCLSDGALGQCWEGISWGLPQPDGTPPIQFRFYSWPRVTSHSQPGPEYVNTNIQGGRESLCLPSPAVRDGGWVGKRVGGRGEVIDKYGDAVMCCKEICGDSWRRRHDAVKERIVTEATLASLPIDFKILMPTPEGPVPRLAELKCINAGKTWYPRGEVVKGVVKRAQKLPGEYEKKLWKYDTRFHGAEPRPDGQRRRRRQQEPQPGPLVNRLWGYGTLCEGQLVAGPWGDLSPHLHSLLKLCAEL